jgi:tetratricopeptide (TPR) repeat protein
LKAFLSTIVLTAILVGAVILLQSIPRRGPEVETEPEAPPRTGAPIEADTQSMAVKSSPAPLSNLDADSLEEVDREALFETGSELLDLWHLPEAIDVFETLVAEDPEHQEGFLRLVECYSHPMVAKERRAEECWNRARDIAAAAGEDTTRVSALRSLFIDYMPGKAIEGITEVVERDGENVDARILLARSLLMNGDPDGAERYLSALLGGDQTLGRARELLIQCKILQGEVETAESLAKDLVALYPEEPYPYVLLSRVQLIQGNVTEATELCENALLLDRRYVPAIVSRAHAYAVTGDVEAARVSFEKLLMFDDQMLAGVAREGIAYVSFLYGRFDEAVESMDEAIRLTMSVGSIRRGTLYVFRLVDYLCELGRVDAAEAVLDRWVSRQTEIPVELAALRILISRGNVPDARSALGQLRQDERWQSWMRSLSMEYADFEALAFVHRNEYRRALQALDASTRDPGGTRRVYLRGYALFQSGEAERAADFLQQTRFRLYGLVFPYHSDPVLFVQSIFFLGEAALARGESDRAQVHYRDFLSYWGDSDWDLQAVERARKKLETLSMKNE